MLIPLGFFDPGGSGPAFELISTQILGGTATSVSFNSIPQGYKHLQLRYTILAPGNGDLVVLRMNGVTSASYSKHFLESTGSSTLGVAGGGSYNHIPVAGWNIGLIAGEAYAGITDILEYTSTVKNKTVKSLNGIAGSTGGEVAYQSGALYSTSAISSITLFTYSGTNMSANSRFSLYGIKG